eukprot:CAMPEP_0180768660 /NCGR_PEP_ID=MMETSP1038_2-20121128/40688_1 /TAXON_ID=632150 /ORGANISM="Azadinium spinosum, Strain 3D9" /LENGTH=73 /DNA_ID=CAMNT_0022803335 /DNA_START=50 /DNA_END=271 /DNA_ORIENTATION=+
MRKSAALHSAWTYLLSLTASTIALTAPGSGGSMWVARGDDGEGGGNAACTNVPPPAASARLAHPQCMQLSVSL